jgi:RNA polymerase sigma-70 factor (ECF subfamily)
MQKDEFLEATLGAMDLVHNLARRVTRDAEAAEDLVQETYLAAFRAWGKHRRPERVEPWIATICLNLARSSFRRTRRRPEETLQAEPGSGMSSEADTAREALSSIDRDAVHDALWALPEEQRVAVTLMDVCGLTARAAARVMGTPRGTVLSRVHRGRKALAALVRGEVEQREP